ncbi:hypothetical protein NPIL_530271 [Nephila pilipes]|uniref:Uncharacterized protein n=1 Tax=Nephila pilipes TaxID=299642 RepID=A0A8X6MQV4_NEPPI|nr:hypothetical protein NPIL_530271 [Nephila pilipes]
MSNCSKSNEEIPAFTRGGEGEKNFNLAGLSLFGKGKKNTWILSISLLLENKYVVCESFWQPSQRFVEFVMLAENSFDTDNITGFSKLEEHYLHLNTIHHPNLPKNICIKKLYLYFNKYENTQHRRNNCPNHSGGKNREILGERRGRARANSREDRRPSKTGTDGRSAIFMNRKHFMGRIVVALWTYLCPHWLSLQGHQTVTL